jgi:Mg-chelatase subunit ChlD
MNNDRYQAPTTPRPRIGRTATRIIGVGLFLATAATLAWLPSLQRAAAEAPKTGGQPIPGLPSGRHLAEQAPVIEAVFVLDTTGSMGGLIQAAKDKIWSIASTMAAAEPAPVIRMGLVAYRDRGDDYVTRVVDLSPDLDAIHAELFQLQANGGGDGPESVNQALHDALHGISWSQEPRTYRVIFLVGDAPPHMDYQDDVKYPETLALAEKRGIRVNAIQCGQSSETTRRWQEIAQLGNGAYFQVDQDGGAVAAASPYDDELAGLSAELDSTRIYYGSKAEREARKAKHDASEAALAAAPTPVLARRAAFAASESGDAAMLGDKELVEEVAAGRVSVDDIPADELPEPLQTLSPDEQRQTLAETAERRARIKSRMAEVAAERARWMREKVAAEGGAGESLDHKLFDALRTQAGAAGLDYDAAEPAY